MKHLLVGGNGAVGTSFLYSISGGYSKKYSEKPHITMLVRDRFKASLEAQGFIAVYDLNRPFNFFLMIIGITSFVLSILLYIVLSRYTHIQTYSLMANIIVLFMLLVLLSFIIITVFLNKVRSIVQKVQMKKIAFDRVTSNFEEIEDDYDLIWLCVSSEHIKQNNGLWIKEIMDKSRNSYLINTTPLVGDYHYILSILPEDYHFRVVQITIPFLSYQYPLSGERFSYIERNFGVSNEIAIFLPPGSCVVVGGPLKSCEIVSNFLKKCGLSVKLWTKSYDSNEYANKFIIPILSCLVYCARISQWKLKDMDTDLMIKGISEFNNVSNFLKNMNIIKRSIVKVVIRCGLYFGQALLPFDFECYLKYHFTKVWDQMYNGLNRMIEGGKNKGFDLKSLKEIKRRIDESFCNV